MIKEVLKVSINFRDKRQNLSAFRQNLTHQYSINGGNFSIKTQRNTSGAQSDVKMMTIYSYI